MPYFRGIHYVIRDIVVTKEKDRVVVNCFLRPARKAITEQILSDTAFVQRDGETLIDTVFFYELRGKNSAGKFKSEEVQQKMTRFSASFAAFEERPNEESRSVSNNDLDDPPMGGEIP